VFLDTSVIVYYLSGDEMVRSVVDRADQLLTSSICVAETLAGMADSDLDDVRNNRMEFSGVRSIDFSEGLALKAADLHRRLESIGDPLNYRDLYIATTAISTGDEFVVADSDFQKPPIEDEVTVTNVLDDSP
jgi:predicted nucleic acid-binding protein